MKENKMLRLASGLLVCVLLSSSVIGGTFAKYTTEGKITDTARVAKWGVVVEATSNLFASGYNTPDGSKIGVSSESVIGLKGNGSDRENVVAPGTGGTMAKATLSGTPEVAVKVSYESTVALTGWEAKLKESSSTASYYCPLKIKIGDTELYGLSYSSTAAFADAIKAEINKMTKTYPPNTPLDGQAVKALDISWKWDFESTPGTAVSDVDCDFADTYLGNAAAGIISGAAPATVNIDVITTVTQID